MKLYTEATAFIAQAFIKLNLIITDKMNTYYLNLAFVHERKTQF